MKNALSEYNKKRDFSQTSEPEGELEVSGKFRFVIQKHAATQLHYDFRIEHDGVLKSWAVPKGLPFKSSDRRLAMHVEDHPVSYFDFEGVIPEGNYGAGNVIVWDMGNYWVPHAKDEKEVESKIEEGFKKGEIKLVLNGEKVNGLFALVRFKRAGENAWLFIKDRDEYEGKDFLKDEKSVISGKTLQEIGEHTNKKAKKSSKSQKLEFIPPMRATLGETPFDSPEYIFEEKFDGYRIIATVKSGKVTLYSRNGENMNSKYPLIVDTLSSKIKVDCTLDGEIAAYDKKGEVSFQMLQNPKGAHELVYHVFDILSLNDISTIDLPLLERKKFLKKVVKNSMRLQVTKFVKEKGKELFKASAKKSEGIIAKKIDSKYLPGERSQNWIKIKNYMREEFVIGGLTYPNGKRQGFGSLIVGYFKKDKLIYAGHVGTGFSDDLVNKLHSNLQKIKRKSSPFSDYEGDKSVQFWVEPALICEVSFAGWTDDNLLRQASLVGIRTDKLPRQVSNEYKTVENIMTNPDKIFFPEKKYTKLDLGKYYFEVAPFILPYLQDRPQNLNRHPNGIHGKNFFHKDIEFKLPDYVDIVKIKRDKPKEEEDNKLDKEISYIVCNNAETLIFMANLGCIEVNPWLSRTVSLDKPDYLVFDIDPSGVDFEIVVKTTKDIFKLLEKVEIQPFIKTSGKRGLHLYSYLGGDYTYEESRSFAELIAKILEQKFPDLISLERSPEKRKKKIYIDYLQNRQGQTTAAVYSARPTVNATVSTPLTLSELNAKLDPTKFDIKNTLKRIEKQGDLWGTIRQNKIDLAASIKLLKELMTK